MMFLSHELNHNKILTNHTNKICERKNHRHQQPEMEVQMNEARSAAQDIQEWKEMRAKLQVVSNATDRLGKELGSLRPYDAQEVNALK